VTALRYLLRQRSYAALVAGTVTLAVGANLVVLTIVNALWLRPRPVTDPDRVVMITGEPGATGSTMTVMFNETGLRNQTRDVGAFESVAGQVMTSGRNEVLTPRIAFEAVSRPVETIAVTPEYFHVLGLAIRGRDFVKEDDLPGAAPVAVISDRLWSRAFDGRSEVIGQIAAATPFPVRIIGVAPPGFQGARLGEDVDLWVPTVLVSRLSGLSEGQAAREPLLGIARLHPGVTVAAAERMVRDAARGPMMKSVVVVPLAQMYGSPSHRTLVINEGPVLRVIATTAILVLLGGCATLMALVLVHYERRRQEFAVRLSLGSSRGRLARHLAAELAWLIAVGSAGALVIAAWGVGALPALELPSGVNLARLNLAIDWRVVVAGLMASAFTIAVGAALPLLRFTDARIARHLITPAATATAGSLRLRKAMLGVHVAATVVVLVAATLFVRTVQYGFATGAGFDVDRTLFVAVDVSRPDDRSVAEAADRARGLRPQTMAERSDQAAWRASYLRALQRPRLERVLAALHEQPGVTAVALGGAPLGPDRAIQVVEPKAIEIDGRRADMRMGWLNGGPDYAGVMNLTVLQGRPLTDADAMPGLVPESVLVTTSAAAALWPDGSAVGRRMRAGSTSPGVDLLVVGVVRDFAFGSMKFDPQAVILGATDAAPLNTVEIVVQATAPAAVVEPARRSIANVLPDTRRLSFVTGRDLVAADLGRERLGAWFFSGFGLVALVLGIGGVFGLIAYLAESRRREFGVRIALGATQGNVVRFAVMAGLVPAVAGAVAGLAGAAWLAKLAESFLIGVGRLDPVSYAGAFSLMLVVAIGAGLAAAWRVRRISPMDALRSE